MAIEGSYDERSFTPKDPWRVWAEVQGIGLYWDTDNQFAAGRQGVRGIQSNPVTPTRSGVRGLAVNTPVGEAPRARATPVNMLGNTRNLSFGGRSYGSQAIDRNEWGRLGSTVGQVAPIAVEYGSQRAERRQTRAQTAPSGVPTPPVSMAGRLAQRWRQRNTPQPPQSLNMGLPQNVPLPPQPGEAPPLPSPTQATRQPSWVTTPPTGPTPSPLATSNWREEQAQRIAEWELGEPGQPTPDVTLGSRTYQQERAQAREARATAPSEPEVGMPTATERWARARQLQTERETARGNTPRNRNLPGSVASGRSAPMPQNPPSPRPGSVGTVPIAPRSGTTAEPAPSVESPRDWATRRGIPLGRWDGEPSAQPTSAVGGQEERLSAEGVTSPKSTRKKNS